MKLKKLLPLITLIAASTTLAQVQDRIAIPDIGDYKTLQCDFHMHTIFSDGLVWPTVRVDEAYREGLDGIAITDHIEHRPRMKDIGASPSHNRSNEIAKPTAKSRDVILLRGSEVTRNMPPGHFNAIFLTDCDALEKPEWRDAFIEAKKQNAFIFWNHPGWDRQAPETTRWFPEHTEIYDKGWMHGIEVANGMSYYKEAFQWALEKKLTILGNSDVHPPIQTSIDFAKGEHRATTLVFAKERSAAAIREALDNRRTAVFTKDLLIGEEQYLRPIFENSIEIKSIKRNKDKVTLRLMNNSGLLFRLKKSAHDERIVYFRDAELKPHCLYSFTITVPEDIAAPSIDFEVTNLLIGPETPLTYSLKLPPPAPKKQ